jgi:hypothetical protein
MVFQIGLLWRYLPRTYMWTCFLTAITTVDFMYLFSWDMISLFSPGWPRTHDSPASGFWMLGLQACTTTPGLTSIFLSVHSDSLTQLRKTRPFEILGQVFPTCYSPRTWHIHIPIVRLFITECVPSASGTAAFCFTSLNLSLSLTMRAKLAKQELSTEKNWEK